MALVAACCRWPRSPARDLAVREASGGVDWALVEKLVARHRVHALVLSALTAAKVSLPAAYGLPWMRGVAGIARQNYLLARESAALQAMLDAAGIPSLIVKGAPLAMLAYGSLNLKHAKDIDLLIAPGDVPAAIGLLEREGYVMWHPAPTLSPKQLRDVIRYDREIEFTHSRHRGLQLELQWALSHNPHILRGLDACAPTQQVDLGGGQIVRTLQRDDMFAYLCAHGASHGWYRLKWLADVVAFAAGHDIVALYEVAKRRGVGQSAGQALVLAEEFLGLNLPLDLACELRGDAKIRRLVKVARWLLIGPGAEKEFLQRRFGQMRMHHAQWLLTRDLRDLRANVAQFMTVTGDVLAVPLPPRLHFLYPVLRVPLGMMQLVRRRRSAQSGIHDA